MLLSLQTGGDSKLASVLFEYANKEQMTIQMKEKWRQYTNKHRHNYNAPPIHTQDGTNIRIKYKCHSFIWYSFWSF